MQVLKGVLAGHVEEDVNDVNAPAISEERGISVSETSTTQARDFTDLLRVTVVSGGERTRVVGTTLGRLHRPAPAGGLGLALQHPGGAPLGRVPL